MIENYPGTSGMIKYYDILEALDTMRDKGLINRVSELLDGIEDAARVSLLKGKDNAVDNDLIFARTTCYL